MRKLCNVAFEPNRMSRGDRLMEQMGVATWKSTRAARTAEQFSCDGTGVQARSAVIWASSRQWVGWGWSLGRRWRRDATASEGTVKCGREEGAARRSSTQRTDGGAEGHGARGGGAGGRARPRTRVGTGGCYSACGEAQVKTKGEGRKGKERKEEKTEKKKRNRKVEFICR